MKTIRVFIASSEELKMERLKFTDMIEQLNNCLEVRGIRLKSVKWEYLDASMGVLHKQQEYNEKLKECELCLVLYWNKFGEYTREELETAYEELKAGRNPHKLYVYFKEPAEDISEQLKDFKAAFATQYGHFYCKFENVDTMRLNFLLQFEQYHSQGIGQEPIVKVKDSQVEVAGQKWVDLKDIPFAGKNPEYTRLQENLVKVQQEIITFETVLSATPNEAIEGLLLQKRIERERLTKEIEEMGNALLDTAKQIVSLSYTASSARLTRAIELFEQGDNKGANAVLNFDEISAEMQQNACRIDQARQLEQQALGALQSNIEECKLKVKTIRAEKPEGWLQECTKIYDTAIEQARGRIPNEDFAELLFDEALLLAENYQFLRAEEVFEEIKEIYRDLSKKNPDAFLADLALTIGNLAILHNDIEQYEEAQKEIEEILNIYCVLSEKSPDAYLSKVAWAVRELAWLHNCIGQYEESEREFEESLSIYLDLSEQNPSAFLHDVALTVGRQAILHKRIGN